MTRFACVRFNGFFANDIDAFIPEFWANESLMILEDNIVAASLVHRDFEPLVANYGDTVNTRRPATFTAVRKDVSDDVTNQDANATNVAVPLNQHLHISFLVRDVEMSKSFKDLVAEFLVPSMIGMAKAVDQIVIGQLPQFLTNSVGGLGSMSSSNAKDYMLDARKKMNNLRVPEGGRNIIWTPNSETEAIKQQLFLDASQVGDGGEALREAALGRKMGFNNYMSQLAGSVSTTAIDSITGAVNMAAGAPVGATSLTVDGLSAAIAAGTWFKVGGMPYKVVSTTGGATPTAITIAAPGLLKAVVDNDVITISDPGAVNLSGGYAAGYGKDIAIDGVVNMPVPGQFVSFGAAAPIYTIISTSGSTIRLDRPLEASIADDAVVGIGPAGEYNFAFRREAIALVVRPLAAPPAGMVRSAVVSNKGLSMRVTIDYDSKAQGTRVTVDILLGVKVLDVNLGVPMLG